MIAAFERFRDEFDAQQDKRERIIKTSREITQRSKKTIFLLHRVAGSDNIEPAEARVSAVRQARSKLRDINGLFAIIAPEVTGDEFWRHYRSVSPGLQEYIEAVAFSHYLEHGTLIPYDEVQKTLLDNDSVPYFALPLQDYLLGVSDLTGELMRFAIVAIARKGGPTLVQQVCTFVRSCHADLEGFVPSVRGLNKKQDVTAESLIKIEQALYAVVVRGAEFRGNADDIADEIVRRYAGASSVGISRRPYGGYDDDGGDRHGDEDD